MKLFWTIAALSFALSSTCYAQGRSGNGTDPALSETNIREAPKANPSAGAPADYLFIPSETIGEKEQYLRFDIPVTEVRVDNPAVLTASVPDNDQRTVVLRTHGVGGTRVVVFGNAERGPQRTRLLYDAQIAVGSRVVTLRGSGREIMDCAPGCYPSPTTKAREPDQITETRNVTIRP